MEITFGKPVEQVVQDAMQTYASGNGPNGEPTPAQDYWMRHEDHLAALAAQQEEIDRLKEENAKLQARLDAMSAPVSDEELLVAKDRAFFYRGGVDSALEFFVKDRIAARAKTEATG